MSFMLLVLLWDWVPELTDEEKERKAAAAALEQPPKQDDDDDEPAAAAAGEAKSGFRLCYTPRGRRTMLWGCGCVAGGSTMCWAGTKQLLYHGSKEGGLILVCNGATWLFVGLLFVSTTFVRKPLVMLAADAFVFGVVMVSVGGACMRNSLYGVDVSLPPSLPRDLPPS